MSIIDLESCAVPDDFAKRRPTAPKVRAPRADEDITVHPEWGQPTVLMAKVGSKPYLVKNNLTRALAGRIFRAKLFAVASSDGEVSVWPAKLDTSAVDAAEAAVGAWKRVSWQNPTKGYSVKDATQKHQDPDWLYDEFQDLIDDAFAGQVLDNLDQPEVKKLLGQIEASNR